MKDGEQATKRLAMSHSLTFILFSTLLLLAIAIELRRQRRLQNDELLYVDWRSMGSAVSSPSGVWGRAPAEIKFGAF